LVCVQYQETVGGEAVGEGVQREAKTGALMIVVVADVDGTRGAAQLAINVL
jgi:hypothetical protein